MNSPKGVIMRAEQVSVTDHALLRWNERVSITGKCHVDEIVDAVKKSKIIKKNEILPYVSNRKSNTVYSQHENVLFIMEPISIDEFKLITVITDSSQEFEITEIQDFYQDLRFPEEPNFSSIKEENDWLLFKKKQIEFQISNEIKGSRERRDLVGILSKIEERIFKNKNKKENSSLSLQDVSGILEQLRQLNTKVDKLLTRSEAQQNMICQLRLKIDKLSSDEPLDFYTPIKELSQ